MMGDSMDGKTLDKFQKANLSSPCMQAMMILFEAVRSYEPWAIKMMDASTKMPEGMITGSISSFGNYDSCLSVKGMDDGNEAFTGKYCALSRNIVQPNSYDTKYLAHELAKAKLIRKALAEVSPVELSISLKLGSTRMSTCLPSTCSDTDVRKIVAMIGREADMNLTVTFCETEEQISGMDMTQVLLMVAIASLVVFVFSCSLFDLTTRGKHADTQDIDHFLESGRPMSQSMLLCWSVFRSYQWIARGRPFEDRFAFIYGIRFLYMFWIFWAYSYAIQNLTAIGETISCSYSKCINSFSSFPFVRQHRKWQTDRSQLDLSNVPQWYPRHGDVHFCLWVPDNNLSDSSLEESWNDGCIGHRFRLQDPQDDACPPAGRRNCHHFAPHLLWSCLEGDDVSTGGKLSSSLDPHRLLLLQLS
jgi:hypothetical protein